MRLFLAMTTALLAAVQPAAAAPGNRSGGGAIPVPSHAAQMRAWHAIRDPLLAEQVRPGRRLDAAQCVVFLGLLDASRAQAAAFRRASRAWRARVVASEGETGANQLIGSSVNPLIPTPTILKQAWAARCLANAPH